MARDAKEQANKMDGQTFKVRIERVHKVHERPEYFRLQVIVDINEIELHNRCPQEMIEEGDIKVTQNIMTKATTDKSSMGTDMRLLDTHIEEAIHRQLG